MVFELFIWFDLSLPFFVFHSRGNFVCQMFGVVGSQFLFYINISSYRRTNA